MLVLHREAWRSARDVTRLSEATGSCAATVYQFADGSVAYFALDAPSWQEADEVTGRALERALRALGAWGVLRRPPLERVPEGA